MAEHTEDESQAKAQERQETIALDAAPSTALAQPATRPDLSFIMPAAVPQTSEQDGALGAEEIDGSQVQIPRAWLAQKTSTAAKELGAVYGELWHSMWNTRLWPIPGVHYDWPEELEPFAAGCGGGMALPLPEALQGKKLLPLIIVPVYCFRDRTMFKDNQLRCAATKGGLLTRAGFVSPVTGGTECVKCPLCLWKREAQQQVDAEEWNEVEDWWRKTDTAPPPCSECINVLSLAVAPATELESMAFVFTKTSTGTGRKFESWLKGSNRPVWSRMYALWPTEEVNPAKQSYAVFAARPLEGWTPAPLAAAARAEYDKFMTLQRTVDVAVHADARAEVTGEENGGVGDDDFFGDRASDA